MEAPREIFPSEAQATKSHTHKHRICGLADDWGCESLELCTLLNPHLHQMWMGLSTRRGSNL